MSNAQCPPPTQVCASWISLLARALCLDEKICTLPPQWYGLWYGMDNTETPVPWKIGNTTIDIRGECKHRLDNQYLFMDLME